MFPIHTSFCNATQILPLPAFFNAVIGKIHNSKEKITPRCAGYFRKCLTLVRRFFPILKSDIIQFGRFLDVVRGVISVRQCGKCPALGGRGVISVRHYLKCPAYIS